MGVDAELRLRLLADNDIVGARLTPFVVLACIFVAPFIDPRRPFRLIHLDVLVLTVFGLYFIRLMDQAAGSPRWAVILADLGLVYILARLVRVGFHPGKQACVGVNVPILPAWSLAVATVLLIAIRFTFPLLDDRPVIDVGYASVEGARQILDGEDLYGQENYRNPELHPDAYGPMNYVLYVPFAYALSKARFAAHAATIVFDLAVLLGLFLLGRRLRSGPDGTRLGIVLAFAWAAYPYSFFVNIYAYNDALVALCLVCALMMLATPLRRGLVIGLGAAAKFTPIVVAPLLATARGDRSLRSLAMYALAITATIIVVVTPFIPDGGLTELYDRTIGWQVERRSFFSIWGQYPSLDALRPLARGAAAVFAISIAFVPRWKTPLQIAALGAAAIIAFQLSLNHWLPSYVVWFAPFAFVAILCRTAKAT